MLAIMAIVMVFFVLLVGGVTILAIVLSTSAIVFSRVAFGLAVALIAHNSDVVLVPGGGFLNYVAWAIILLGVIFLLSSFPRVDAALKFFCTIIMSIFMIEIAVMLFGSIISNIQGKDFQITLLYELLLKIICTVLSLGAVIVQATKKPYDSPSNIIMLNLERLVASAIYGVAVAFLSTSLHQNWNITDVGVICVLVGVTVLAFVADIFLEGKNLLGGTQEQEVVMPR